LPKGIEISAIYMPEGAIDD